MIISLHKVKCIDVGPIKHHPEDGVGPGFYSKTIYVRTAQGEETIILMADTEDSLGLILGDTKS